MSASQPNLVNSKDSTYKISSVSGTNQHLAANQWGYGMGKTPTVFSSVSSASLADITSNNKGNCSSVDDCTLYLTFGANIDSKRLPVGNYSTTLTYTAVSKPAPYVPSTPSSGGGSSSGGVYRLCEDRYPDIGADADGWLYCFNHNGDMIGYKPYWNKVCGKKYSDDYDKISYCKDHDGDMSGYWDETCSKRYPGSDVDSGNKRKYCVYRYGDMSGYLDWLCNGLYPGQDYLISLCKENNGRLY